MKISVIIPHLGKKKPLPRTLETVRAAAEGLDVETILVEDAEGRGVSWARNRGLERASGEYIFFVDADDAVAKDFFAVPLAELEKTGADICFFDAAGLPFSRSFALEGNAAIREAFFSAFLGYSFEDVRRWNAGGRLWKTRELGYVWRAAFRRAFLEEHAIRFDEALRINEDAAFLSTCALYAVRTAQCRKALYEYHPNPDGLSSRASRERLERDYKFAVLDFRLRLDTLAGGGAWKYCEASCVFAALEILRRWRGRGLARYLARPRVRGALRDFPLSWRHPAVAAAIVLLRFLSCCSR